MSKLTLLYILVSIHMYQILAFIENKKHGGHNLFHGLKEDRVKQKEIIEKLETQEKHECTHIHGEHKHEIVEKLGMGLASGNRNNIFSNFDAEPKKSSIYLQPESRGLQYMMNTGDYNPFSVHYIGRRSLSSEFVSEPHNKSKKKCDGLHLFCVLRKSRQIPLEPGNVIPGSRGQSILLGVPHGTVSDVTSSTPRASRPNIHISIPHGSFRNEQHERTEETYRY
ncbi:hypothetical protein WA026_002170 [Henosepilachna vigintioctopunctata]|uniref:Uncharacterized protein n=1 Tax=Henosepilachna vigintioctopunctata TaxID=420089 RepID=A0AAW1U0D7_9CUCU